MVYPIKPEVDPIDTPKIFDSEYRLCLIVWETEPVNSTELVRLSRERLGWSKATTYTVLRRLCERGVLKNESATVTSLVSKQEAQSARMEELMDRAFEGSLPAFVAAFARHRGVTKKELEDIRRLIDEFEEEG